MLLVKGVLQLVPEGLLLHGMCMYKARLHLTERSLHYTLVTWTQEEERCYNCVACNENGYDVNTE